MAPPQAAKNNFTKMRPGTADTLIKNHYDHRLNLAPRPGVPVRYTPFFPNSAFVCAACWRVTANPDTHVRHTSDGGCANFRAMVHINECCAYYDCTVPRCEVLRGMFQAGVMEPEEIMAQGKEWDPANNPIRQNNDYPVRPHLVGQFFFDIVDEYSDKERMPLGPDMSFVHSALAACPDAKQETKFLNKMYERTTRAAITDSMVKKGFSAYQSKIIDKLFDKKYSLSALSKIDRLLSNPENSLAKKATPGTAFVSPGKRKVDESITSVAKKVSRKCKSNDDRGQWDGEPLHKDNDDEPDKEIDEENSIQQFVSQDCEDSGDGDVVEL